MFPSSLHVSRTTLLALWCFAGFLLTLAINYPGFMVPDSVTQLLEARAGVYSDWHPPFMAFVWRSVDKIVPGSLGMFVVMTGLIWTGSFLVAKFWFADSRHIFFPMAASWLVFYPPVFATSGALVKDNFMWAFLMLAIGTLGARHEQRRLFIGVTASLLLALLYRYNAMFALIPLVGLGILRSTDAKTTHGQWAKLCVAGVVVYSVLLFCSTYINRSLTTYEADAWRSTAEFDIAGTIHHMHNKDEQKALYDSLPPRLRGNGTFENIFRSYDPRYWGALKEENPAFAELESLPDKKLTPEESTSLKQAWKNVALHYTGFWLQHRLLVFRHLVGLTNDELFTPVMMDPNAFQNAYTQNPDPQPNQLQNAARWFMTHLSWHLIFRPWVYLVIGILVTAGCLLSRSRERLEIALIAGSGLAHEAGLFLFAPSVDFRYSQYMIYASLLVLLLFAQSVQTRHKL